VSQEFPRSHAARRHPDAISRGPPLIEFARHHGIALRAILTQRLRAARTNEAWLTSESSRRRQVVRPPRRDGMQIGWLLVAPLMVGLVAPAGAQVRRGSVELRAGAAIGWTSTSVGGETSTDLGPLLIGQVGYALSTRTDLTVDVAVQPFKAHNPVADEAFSAVYSLGASKSGWAPRAASTSAQKWGWSFDRGLDRRCSCRRRPPSRAASGLGAKSPSAGHSGSRRRHLPASREPKNSQRRLSA
jgi:hypothetical protein